MKKAVAGIIASLALAAPAGAAVITLEGISSVTDGFRFDYEGTLGPDEGVSSGSRLIIYDFDGYVDGSIFAPVNVMASTELTTDTPFMIPGHSDDPTKVNLVFTYTGPDFRTVDGPFDPFSFNGFGAVSIFEETRRDAFASFTIKNNPDGAEGTQLIQVGIDLVPSDGNIGSAIPEPATWAMMIGGLGLVGASMRRRRSPGTVTA